MYAKIKINEHGPFYIQSDKNLTILGFAQQLEVYVNKLETIGLIVLAIEISDKFIALSNSDEDKEERNKQNNNLINEILNIRKIIGI